jgi:hypothetical protein
VDVTRLLKRIGAVADRYLIVLVVLQALTGLMAIAALIYVLALGPRVERVEKRVIEVQRIVREIVRKEVVPGKPPTHGHRGPASEPRRGPVQGGDAPRKLPEVGRPGPASVAERAPSEG